jgi:hypothetical protein
MLYNKILTALQNFLLSRHSPVKIQKHYVYQIMETKYFNIYLFII